RAPAVVEVQTVEGISIGRSAPTIPFATILGGRTGRPTELTPPGLCTSDITPDETCATGKLHFRVTECHKLIITVEGIAQSPGDFTILLDPLQEQPRTQTLLVNGVVTSYLAYGGEPDDENPHADFSIELSKGQHIGILLGSPDFTTEVKLLDENGILVASN